MAIRAIIFDCFGVLYTDGKSRIIEACPDKNRQALGELFLQADYGFITGDEFSVAAAGLLGISPAELAAMVGGLYARNEPLVEHIRRYKQQYKIGLLSNVSENLFSDLFSPVDQAELFDTVVLSSRVGMVKPSAGIYVLTATQLGVDPSECIMIDDIERNVQGAREAGLHGELFVSTNDIVNKIDQIIAATT